MLLLQKCSIFGFVLISWQWKWWFLHKRKRKEKKGEWNYENETIETDFFFFGNGYGKLETKLQLIRITQDSIVYNAMMHGNEANKNW